MNGIVNWSSAWRLAVGTLTVFPVRPPAAVDRAVAGRAMLLAPLAVLPLALVASGVGRLAQLTNWPPLVGGLVVIGVLALGTRALHLDGLADTVDGLGSGRDRDLALEIMRRGDVGPMGVVALVLVLGAQAVAASSLTVSWPGAAILAVAIAVSRSSLLLACRTGVPAARPSGLGAAVAGSVGRSGSIVAGLAAVVMIGAAVATGRSWWIALVALVVAAVIAYGVVRLAVRRLGGITGDVLGATIELSLTALLLGLTL